MTFWKRYTQLTIGVAVLTSAELDIYFKVPVSTDSDADTAEIIVFNLADATVQGIETDMPVTIETGYEEDYGIIFIGAVKSVSGSRDGADMQTVITCVSGMADLMAASVNASYPAGTLLTDVATDQIQLAGMTDFKIDANPAVFETGKTYTTETSVRDNLQGIADNLGYTLTERRGSIIMIDSGTGIEEGVVLNADTGLLQVTKNTAEDDAKLQFDYELITLLIYQMAQGSIIELDSRESGVKVCRVEECEFVSNAADHICNMKVKII